MGAIVLVGWSVLLAQGKITIRANGASFPDRLYIDAAYAYTFVNPQVEVSYVSTGSGKGKCRIMNFTEQCDVKTDGAHVAPLVIDWAGSDSLLRYPSNYEAYPDLQMYPAVAGAVVPIYNLAGRREGDPELLLTPRILAKIFGSDLVEGGILYWDDPSIVALNPALNASGVLTHTNIQVVVREESSGTTEIFTKALSDFDESFASRVGITSGASRWSPRVTKAGQNSGVAAVVLSTANSISYSVLAEANVLKLSKAEMLTVKFWRWFWTSPVVAELAVLHGFAPLPEVVKNVVLGSLLEDIRCNGRVVFEEVVQPTVYGMGSSLLSSLFSLFTPAYSAATDEATLVWSDACCDGSQGNVNIAAALEGVLSSTLLVGNLPSASQGFALVDHGCSYLDVQLRLSLPLLADILDGTASSWNDTALLPLNAWLADSPLATAATHIRLIGQPAESETMQNLLDLMRKYKPTISFATTFGASGSAIIEGSIERARHFPSPLDRKHKECTKFLSSLLCSQRGTSSYAYPLAPTVRSRALATPQSIAITPLIGSIQPLLKLVPLVVASGDEITPSAASLLECASDTFSPSAAGFNGRIILQSSNAPGCYPLAEAMVIMMRRHYSVDECMPQNVSKSLPVIVSEFASWLTSEPNRPPITTNGMAPLSGIHAHFDTLQLNSLCQYFDTDAAACADCPEASGNVAVFVVLLCTASLILGWLCFLLNTTNKRWQPVARTLRRTYHHAKKNVLSSGVVTKMKVALTFMQIVAALDSTYTIGMPDSWFQWTSILRVFGSIDWSGWIVPSTCLIGSGVSRRLLVRSLAPLILICIVPVVCAATTCFKRQLRSFKPHVDVTKATSCSASVKTSRDGFIRGLPASLVLAFCFTPSVSAVIFRAWYCVSFAFDKYEERRFLADDLSVQCDGSSEHNRILLIAWVMVAIWPIGMVVMYTALLLPCRHMLLDEAPESPLLKATSFLHRDYKPAYYWWEVVSLMQRTTLTGWLLLVDFNLQFIRILCALIVTIAFSVALLVCQPYKRQLDFAMASGAQLLLVCIFIGGIIMRLYEDIANDSAGSKELAFRFLGIHSSEEIAIIMILVALLMLVLLGLTVVGEELTP
ncbi:hypothetical protein AB1Y20_013725 [Prymnesium parvum]|uniref:PBP domain-containing protein n=1 Tax=Prymnesium parvum TaxID=97485 RepID=A0AB34IFX2_PRYPA